MPSFAQAPSLHLPFMQHVIPHSATTHGTSLSRLPGGRAQRLSQQKHWQLAMRQWSGLTQRLLPSRKTQRVSGSLRSSGLISPAAAVGRVWW